MDTIPYGYCHCGCGEKTAIAAQNRPSRGWIKGEPKRFLPRHNKRKFSSEYTVVDAGYETPCWLSNRTKQPSGHAQIRFGGKTRWLHRVAYKREHGPIPPGMHVHHLCEQPACQRVSHMTLRTLKDHGIEHGQLSDEKREALVEAGKDRSRTYKDIATEFNVTEHCVSRIMTEHGIRRYKV